VENKAKMKIVQVGLGPLGQKIVRYALERGHFEIVAAVDPAPDKAGRDLGDICGIGKGLTVSADLQTALRGKSADVAILSTVSSLEKLEPQVAELARAGLNIVSTCEELSFPWRTNPGISERLDGVLKESGVACVGTGVNPGYLMDFLPVVATAVCQRVDIIQVSRIQNASCRRIPFQQKIGAGLSLSEFQSKVDQGTLRHVGLTESMHMIAHSMGWILDGTTESLDPVLADRNIEEGYRPIRAGEACGVQQVSHAYVNGKETITLLFRAAVGEPESYDKIEIKGEPDITLVIPGGVNGDIATCAITLNAIRSILRATPGLKTMLDIPAVTFSQSLVGI
jgi:4-hydroxy-tetrahydrodipicolinate reductase